MVVAADGERYPASFESLGHVAKLFVKADEMRRIHTISGKSDLPPNYFLIGTDSRTLITNAHSLESGEEQYETVKFWDLATGQLTRTVDFRHDHIAVSTYENWLLGIVYNAGVIIKLNIKTGRHSFILGAAPRCLTGQNNVTPIVASLYEPLIACGGKIQEIAVYNLLEEPINSDEYATTLSPLRFSVDSPELNPSVLISPDSNFLFSQSLHRGFHHLWDVRSAKLIRKYDSSTFGVSESLALNDSEELLACSYFLGRIQIWNLLASEMLFTVSGELPAILSSDGRLLAYCNVETKIVLWDVKNNQEITISDESAAAPERLAFSPDGRWLASYTQDQKIEIWSII
jgi:WD40 repeat protein